MPSERALFELGALKMRGTGALKVANIEELKSKSERALFELGALKNAIGEGTV